MRNASLIKQLREFRGDVLVGMLIRNDVTYVKAVKSDLIAVLTQIPEGAVKLDIVNGVMYVDATDSY